jgi:hypothetical protein
MQQAPKPPTPNFYKVISVFFLVFGIACIVAAVVKGGWVFWAFGIMSIANSGMSFLKSLVPRETKR